jgi:hypothetical protein
MEEVKTVEITSLLALIRQAVAEDWNDQRAKGERQYAYSESAFQRNLAKERPEIKTGQFWKTVYAYDKYNREESPSRAIGLDRLKIVLNYLFTAELTPYGWPTVVEVLKSFAGGKFYNLVSDYLVGFDASVVERHINRSSLALAGATAGQDIHTQLLQLAIKAKANHQATKDELNDLKQALALRRERDNKIDELRAKISRLESIVSQHPKNSEELLIKLDEIKQKFDL